MDDDERDQFEYVGLLNHAVAHGDTAQVLELLANGANVNDKSEFKKFYGWTPLMFASYYGYSDILRILLDHGANVNDKSWSKKFYGWTPLMFAIDQEHTDILRILLNNGADANEDLEYREGWTPLTFAAYKGNTNILEILLSKGADIDAREIDGYTALMIAIRYGQLHIAEYLVENGAHLHFVDRDCGDNVLTLCAEFGNLHLFDILLVYGATDINHTACYDMSSLMIAIANENYDIAKRLIELDCELDFQSTAPWYRGFTALMLACFKNNLELVKMLVENNCDIHIRSEAGETALDIATNGGHMEIADYLKRFR